MKAHKNWSYSPYTPPFFDSGDIYICRVVPSIDSIHFEWLECDGADIYKIYIRKRFEEEFIFVGTTSENEFDIKNLEPYCNYEFYVESNGKKSRIRLARCGKSVDNIVNYLHPEDKAYSFSGRYLCSPSLVRHPDGYLLASMDLFEGYAPQNLTLIFRSDDEGKNWHYVSELFPCFWGKMFIYENELYMIGSDTEYGGVLIGKSTDGGKTFGEPTVLLRGSNGKKGEAGFHRNPQPVVEFNGRIWNTLEYGSWDSGYHAAMVMSAKCGSDLLDADNWLFSEPLKYNYDWEGVPEGKTTGNIEGCLVVQNDRLYNVMRYDMSNIKPYYGYVLAYEVDTENPENPLIFDRCIRFSANHAKFEIKYDEKRQVYFSIVSRITDASRKDERTLLSLMASYDLDNWYAVKDIFDYTSEDATKIGFQYVDFIIEGDKIIYLCRTGMNGAKSHHDTNYSTFGTLDLNNIDLNNMITTEA